jgi:hypothetical protein
MLKQIENMRAWTLEEIRAIVDGMRARRGGFRVSAETAPLVISAIDLLVCERAAKDLRYFVEWVDAIASARECLATANSADLAITVYECGWRRAGGSSYASAAG